MRRARDLDFELDLARASHLNSLLDDEFGGAFGQLIEALDHGREGCRGRPCRRVFRDPHPWSEHAGVEGRLMVYRFTTIKEDFTIAGVESSVPMSDDNLRPAHRVQVPHRNESERNARIVLGRLVVGKADLLRREAESGGDPVLMRGRSRKLRQFRHIELGIRGVPAAANHAHADAADPFFQDYEGIAIGGGSRNPVIGKLNGRADRRMSSKLQFGRGREDANLGRMRRKARRQHKHGLGQVELACDGLHGLRAETPCV